MKKVSREELLDITEYEKIRADFREKLMALKNNRRILVGGHLNFLFENHDTVLYQIQEMMRVERIVEEAAILHELNTYNEMIPPEGGLSATLLIEFETPEQRAVELIRLKGLEGALAFQVGDLPPVPAQYDARQVGEERLSSVQYLQFPLGPEHRAGWMEAAKNGTLQLQSNHPHFTYATTLPLIVAETLAQDFA